MDFLKDEFWGLTIETYIRFGVILILALLLKRYLSKIIAKIFFSFTKKISNDEHSNIFQSMVLKPIESVIITLFFYIAIEQLAPLLDSILLFNRKKVQVTSEVVKELVPTSSFSVMDLVDRIFFFVLIFTIAQLVIRIVKYIFYIATENAKVKKDRERQQIFPLLRDVLNVVIGAMAFFTVLGVVFHVNVVTLIAGLGMGGIAVAFALKDSLENLLSSFMILIDKPFTIGDWVKVSGVEGTVEKVGFRSTRIRTFDRTQISLPNKDLISSSLENFSVRGLRRVKFQIGAEYGLSKAQLQNVIKILYDRIDQHPETSTEPSVTFDNFGDSSLNIIIVYYVKIPSKVSFDKIKEEINFIIYEVMYEHATGFPYPTQTTMVGEHLNNVSPKAVSEQQI